MTDLTLNATDHLWLTECGIDCGCQVYDQAEDFDAWAQREAADTTVVEAAPKERIDPVRLLRCYILAGLGTYLLACILWGMR